MLCLLQDSHLVLYRMTTDIGKTNIWRFAKIKHLASAYYQLIIARVNLIKSVVHGSFDDILQTSCTKAF